MLSNSKTLDIVYVMLTQKLIYISDSDMPRTQGMYIWLFDTLIWNFIKHLSLYMSKTEPLVPGHSFSLSLPYFGKWSHYSPSQKFWEYSWGFSIQTITKTCWPWLCNACRIVLGPASRHLIPSHHYLLYCLLVIVSWFLCFHFHSIMIYSLKLSERSLKI